MPEEFGRCHIAERLMRPDVIVGVLPFTVRRAERQEITVPGRGFVELFGVGAVGALDGAIELLGARGARRRAECRVAGRPAQRLQRIHCPCQLESPDGHRHPALERREELGEKRKGDGSIFNDGRRDLRRHGIEA